MSDWQPIETALQDGTLLIVGYVDGFVFSARFLNRRSGKPPRGWYREGAGISCYPTHWQPLPEPPDV